MSPGLDQSQDRSVLNEKVWMESDQADNRSEQGGTFNARVNLYLGIHYHSSASVVNVYVGTTSRNVHVEQVAFVLVISLYSLLSLFFLSSLFFISSFFFLSSLFYLSSRLLVF